MARKEMSVPRSLALTLFVLMLVGCVRAGFEGHAVDLGAVDSRPLDGGGEGDSTADGSVSETTPPDTAVPDGASPDGGCNVPTVPAELANCTSACADPDPENIDCDGLDDAYDPEVPSCNHLVLPEVFSRDPATVPTLWSQLGPQSWSCGAQRLEAGASLNTVPGAVLPGDSRFLVEARFKLAQIYDPDTWSVTFELDEGGDANFQCSMWVRATLGVPSPVPRIASLNACLTGDGYNPASPFPPGAVGQIYTLRFWHLGTDAHCQLVNEDGSVARSGTFPNVGACVPLSGERIGLWVANVSIDVLSFSIYTLNGGSG